ncbi:MAG: CDP-glycerol glycerophosphotransferase family protein [Acutalibacteraceae bacterium]
MKKLIYAFYALLFNLSAKLFKVKKNRVAFVSMHNESFNDSLGEVRKVLEEKGGYEFVLITRKDLEFRLKNVPRALSFFFVKARKLATSKYVFLNDNFLPMAGCNFKKEAVVVQLWHAEGVFKKFGLSIEQPEDVRTNEIESNKRLSFVVCSSKNVVPYYAEAFGVSEDKVLPLGSARTDWFFKKENLEAAKRNFYKQFPDLQEKKLVLYAPTFRDDPEQNEKLLEHFDAEKLTQLLGDEYAVLLRLHPQVRPKETSLDGTVDVTEYKDVRELVAVCDALITDYSSICMDFSLLDKKTVFFAFDLEEYRKDRDFYFDYADYVPGPVTPCVEDAAKALLAPFDREKNEKFKRFNFDYTDSASAKRIAERIVLKTS